MRADQGRSRFDFSLNICEVEEDPRYDGNRVRGLKFTLPASPTPEGATLMELTVDDEMQRIPEDATLLEGAQFVRNFDSVLGALEGSLRFLGEEPTPVQLFGGTGHAFRICVSDSLDFRGVGMADLEGMRSLYENMGYQVKTIIAREEEADFIDRQEEAWEAIRESIDRGAPVVARFGPFFWMIKGYHVKEEEYYLSAFMSMLEEPVAMSDLGGAGEMMGTEIGGLEVLILGERREVEPAVAARRVLEYAVEEARCAPEPEKGYCRGLKAFEHWAAELESGRVAKRFSPALTAGVVVMRRKNAAAYTREVAPLFAAAAPPLREAASCYEAEMASLGQLMAMFPLMGGGESIDLEDEAQRQQAAQLIREAQSWEEKAVERLEEALALME